MHKLAILICLAVCLSGCSETTSQADSKQQPRKPKVALIMKSLANEFFVAMADGTREHQRENADQYELVVNGIKNESDLTQQVALVEQMIAARADAIVIAPADSKALIPVIRKALAQDIVVVNIDNKLDAELLQAESMTVPFVGPDNREGARMVGEYLGKHLEPGDEVAIIGGMSTAFNAQQRQQGFEDAMKSAGAQIVSIQNADWEQARASTIASAIINEHPNLKALLCSNDSMAIGAVAALRQAGKNQSIKVVGFDNISAVQQLIQDNSMLATADQYGHLLAVYGVEAALRILKGADAPKDRKTPIDLVTRDTIRP